MKIYRIYFSGDIQQDKTITLNEKDSHHLINVLRLQPKALISIFNENGEWLTQIVEAHKNKTKVLVLRQTKVTEMVDKWIHLVYAPLKHTASSFLITKATELGVNEITQVITEQTTSNALPVDKIVLKTKEAAQQCGRLSLPKINHTLKLKDFINTLQQPLLWLNEKHLGDTFIQIVPTLHNPYTILIGPEAGFNDNEYNMLLNNPFVLPVYLQGNILKAETIGLVTISYIKYTNQ